MIEENHEDDARPATHDMRGFHKELAQSYRDRAAEALRLAEDASLANVREIQERAAARWIALAEMQEMVANRPDHQAA